MTRVRPPIVLAAALALAPLPARAQQALDVAPPPDIAAFRTPGPDRAPVAVESERGAQSVGVVLAYDTVVTDYSHGRAMTVTLPIVSDLCTTPCTLYVPPGRIDLRTGADGVAAGVAPLAVPPGGLRVRMRAIPMPLYAGSSALLAVGGLGVLVGVALLLVGATHAAGASSSGLVIGGAITGGTALALFGLGLALFLPNQPGPASIRAFTARRAAPPRLAVAPVAGGGATATAVLTF